MTATCPTCESPDPKKHPAVQFEGEVNICRDPFHAPEAAPLDLRTEPEWLTALRTSMVTEIGALPIASSPKVIADLATGVAAYHLHPVHAELADARRAILTIAENVRGTMDNTADLDELPSEIIELHHAAVEAQDKVRALDRELRDVRGQSRQQAYEITRRNQQIGVLEDAAAHHAVAVRGYEEALQKSGVHVANLQFELRRQEDVVQALRGGRLDAFGDMETKLQAMREEMTADESGPHIISRMSVERAKTIAERHMLALAKDAAAYEEPYKVGRWAESEAERAERHKAAKVSQRLNAAMHKTSPVPPQTYQTEEVEDPMVNWRIEQDEAAAPSSDWRALLFHDLTEASDGKGRVNRGDARDIAASFIEPLRARLNGLEEDWNRERDGRLSAEHRLQQIDAPSPEMREVPVKELRDGDTFTGTFLDTRAKDEIRQLPTTAYVEFGMGAGYIVDVVITRPVSPPIAPEAALRALVAALKDPEVYAITAKDDVRAAWLDAVRALEGSGL